LSIYNEFFGFKETPFSLTPDPEFLFLSSVHREALAYLRYGLREKKGFVLITGEVGSGKTTLLRSLLKDVHHEVRTALIINPRVEFEELMQAVFTDLEIDVDGPLNTKTEMLDAFYGYLLNQHEVGCNVVLIFDEAQHLSLPVFEEIRMLSNFETPKEKLLQIIFVGQPELRQKLALPQLRQLRQRITVRYHINPLNMQEVAEYIKHRLQVAGANDPDVFAPEAVDRIYEFSGGTPRIINVICDSALLAAFADSRNHIDAELVQETIREQQAYENGTPEAEPVVEQSPSAAKVASAAAPDTEMILEIVKTVLRLQGDVAEHSSELADAATALRQRLQEIDKWLDSSATVVPEELADRVGEAVTLLTQYAGQIDIQHERLAPKLDALDSVLNHLNGCIDRAHELLNRLGVDYEVAEAGQDPVDEDKETGIMKRRLRVHCSRCNGVHYIEGTFCPHCWEHMRRLKIGGILDS